MRLTRAGVASASSACCSARCSSSRSSAMALYLAELRMQREELFRHLVLRRKINQRRGAVVGFTHDHAAGYMVGENRQTLAFQFLDQLARQVGTRLDLVDDNAFHLQLVIVVLARFLDVVQ